MSEVDIKKYKGELGQTASLALPTRLLMSRLTVSPHI